MSDAVPSVQEKEQRKNSGLLKSLAYLPEEGLQGEDIPSHILWENADVKYIEVVFCSPLKFKEVFNAESWRLKDNKLIVEKIEMNGYLGLSLTSSKVSDLEVDAPVEYLITLRDGNTIKEEKKIRLFRPQIAWKVQNETINIVPETLYVKDRIRIKNIGRGTLLICLGTGKESPTQLEVPSKYLEFAEKFYSDLIEELKKLANDFPQLQKILDDIEKWEPQNILEISSEERAQFKDYQDRIGRLLASDRDFLEAFMNAYGKALAKNSELLETISRVVRLYESLVSKNILLINPFDEITVNEKSDIILRIAQTDKVLDHYEEIVLPAIGLTSPKEVKIPVYRLFEWG
jgi:hypothetical protein